MIIMVLGYSLSPSFISNLTNWELELFKTAFLNYLHKNNVLVSRLC